MLLSDGSALTPAQRKKIQSILASAGKSADAILLDVRAPPHLPEGTVCVSLLARMTARHEIQAPRACFVEPAGRHHWR